MDMDTDIDTDMDDDIKFSHFSLISVQRYRRYSAVWIICDTSWLKFLQRFKLVALLPDKNYDMQI
jgi:hypothetical protein